MMTCLVFGAQAPEDGLTARDAFWSASDLVGKRPSNVPAPRKTAASPMADVSSNGKSTATTASRPPSPPTIADTASVQQVALDAPLGLRYSVLQRRPDGTFEEVSPGSAFHAGDRIRLRLMSNQAGYLYIIEHGSSGKWRPLYPPAGEAEKQLKAGQEYLVPGGQNEYFEFNGDPGQEKLFVLLSRVPETNLDQTIAELRDRRTAVISDGMVAGLRNQVQARDLIFTKAEDEPQGATGAKEDKATYVVNKASNTKPDPHIVVDVVLSHK